MAPIAPINSTAIFIGGSQCVNHLRAQKTAPIGKNPNPPETVKNDPKELVIPKELEPKLKDNGKLEGIEDVTVGMLDRKDEGIPNKTSEGKVTNKDDIGKIELVVMLDIP